MLVLLRLIITLTLSKCPLALIAAGLWNQGEEQMDILYNIIAVKYSGRPEISRTILDGRPSLSLTQKLL